MIKSVTLATIVGLLVVACAAPTDNAADEAAIRAVDIEMVAALNARDLDTWIGFLAEDARMMPPGSSAVEGKPAIRQLISGLLSLPDFSVVHHPLDSVVVSESGDLAYVSYAYELTVPDDGGGSVTELGKDISVFGKEADGSWRLLVDIWNANE